MTDIDFDKATPNLTLLQGGASAVRSAAPKVEPFKAIPETNHYNRDQITDVMMDTAERNETLSRDDIAAIDMEMSRLSENYIEFMEDPSTIDRLSQSIENGNAPAVVSDYLYNITKPQSDIEREAALMALRLSNAVEQIEDRRSFYDRFDEVKASIQFDQRPESAMEAYFHAFGPDADPKAFDSSFIGFHNNTDVLRTRNPPDPSIVNILLANDEVVSFKNR